MLSVENSFKDDPKKLKCKRKISRTWNGVEEVDDLIVEYAEKTVIKFPDNSRATI